MARVSLIATVRNEATAVEALLASIATQSRPPDEVVVCDGGSSDGTLAILRAWLPRLPLRVVEAPGANISRGRNRAIAAASGPVIASTDAGVRLEPGWLAALLGPFDDWEDGGHLGRPPVACGFFVSAPQSVFELALAAVTLPLVTEVHPERFLPSSRSVAFAKEAWSAVGGYPEWLDYSEDLVFDLQLREAGYPFVWVPQALVHFRPRPDLGGFVRQYYHYGRGDGKADLWRLRHAIRYGAYFAGMKGAVVGFWQPVIWLALAIVGVPYLVRPYLRLLRLDGGWTGGERLAAAALVPLLRAAGDVAKMAGYPAGVLWRRRERGGRGWRGVGRESPRSP